MNSRKALMPVAAEGLIEEFFCRIISSENVKKISDI